MHTYILKRSCKLWNTTKNHKINK